ncbi:DNA glycosylase [Fontisphaera persica]|uniref:DNA-3-methyladenine glycosylase family protein n=1 Tax=Fontisphaera persica TaxID=2974023 RepID=UPI0024BF904F|nr:DNA glycosylase [Fontisphaera persica]WCJ58264.1 DNA glycosylase [Fontisphaera persica]
MRTPAEHWFPVRHYNLPLTLSCGQSFRWRNTPDGWEGVVAGKWVRLRPLRDGLQAFCAEPVSDWQWLADYLQLHVRLEDILQTFPAHDPHLQKAVQACFGLRLLRQEPWECLASFILSSTKQIPHIQQIIECLCLRFGAPVCVPPGHAPVYAFPEAATLARAGEEALRGCRMGFRARALQEAACRVAEGVLNLESLRHLDEAAARRQLMSLRGVGPKIANCVLLFAYGFPRAFPVDVWVRRALREAYFPRRRPTPRRLEAFIQSHFGPHAGYAQQYLFHYWRTGRAARRKIQ